jgi:hypothetical protein
MPLFQVRVRGSRERAVTHRVTKWVANCMAPASARRPPESSGMASHRTRHPGEPSRSGMIISIEEIVMIKLLTLSGVVGSVASPALVSADPVRIVDTGRSGPFASAAGPSRNTSIAV